MKEKTLIFTRIKELNIVLYAICVIISRYTRLWVGLRNRLGDLERVLVLKKGSLDGFDG